MLTHIARCDMKDGKGGDVEPSHRRSAPDIHPVGAWLAVTKAWAMQGMSSPALRHTRCPESLQRCGHAHGGEQQQVSKRHLGDRTVSTRN